MAIKLKATSSELVAGIFMTLQNKTNIVVYNVQRSNIFIYVTFFIFINFVKNNYFTCDHLHGKEHRIDFEFVDVALRAK